MSFQDTLGHDGVLASLVAAHARGAVHHALLLAGPDGVGKRRVAYGFAALVNCVGDAPVDAGGRRIGPCGTCRSCRRILAGGGAEHPDVLRLEVAEGERAIKIERVREVLRVLPFPPIEARVRFVVVSPAEAMTTEAANALLKTLEEPPSHTRFLLVSSRPDLLLATIRSRCQRVPFGRLAPEDVVRVLVRERGVEIEEARRVASMADGSPGAALALLEDPIMAKRDDLVRRVVALPPGDAGAVFALAGELSEEKEHLRTIFEVLRRLLRDAILLRSGAGAEVGLSLPHLREDATGALAARFGTEALLLRIGLVDETERGIATRNLNARLAFERLLLALSAKPGREAAAVGIVP